MKKLVCMLLAIMMMMGLCAASLAEGEVQEIVIWGGVPAENGPQAVCDAFNEKYEGQYHATYYRFVNDDSGNTKLETALLSGEKIDVFFSYTIPRIIMRDGGNMMYDLRQIEGAEDWIKETLIDDCLRYVDDRIVYIPTNNEPQFLFCNKDLFDAAGIDIPKAWTFEEFRDVAKRLTADGHYGAYLFRKDAAACEIMSGKDYFYNEDGTGAGFDTEANRYATQLIYDMTFEDKSAYPYGDILSLGISAYPQDLLIGQDVAIIESSYWFLRYIKNLTDYPHEFITAFAPMPTAGTGFNNGSINNFISIANNTTVLEGSWEFVKFWLAEGYDKLYVGGKLPVVRAEVDQDELVAGLLGEDAEKLFDIESFMNVFSADHKYDLAKYTIAVNEINQIMNEERDNLFLGAYDVDTFMTTVQERIAQAIADAQ